MRDMSARSCGLPARTAAGLGDPFQPFDDIDQVEQQPASGGVGLQELHPDLVAQAVVLAGALADQELAALVVALHE